MSNNAVLERLHLAKRELEGAASYADDDDRSDINVEVRHVGELIRHYERLRDNR